MKRARRATITRREPIRATFQPMTLGLGSAPFPFDMLRYDRCWPARERDSIELAASENLRDWKGCEITVEKVAINANPWTDARWASFGWKRKEEK